MSKFVANILKNYTTNDHCKNSAQFLECIRNIEIEEDECMISFDVTSIYTSVPINNTLIIIKDLLKNDPDFNKKTSIPIEEFLKLVTLVLTKTWYLFDGKFFTQTDGVVMGGPASSIVAEI